MLNYSILISSTFTLSLAGHLLDDDLTVVLPPPGDVGRGIPSGLARQLGRAALRDHHVAGGLLVDKVRGHHHIQVAHLKQGKPLEKLGGCGGSWLASYTGLSYSHRKTEMYKWKVENISLRENGFETHLATIGLVSITLITLVALVKIHLYKLWITNSILYLKKTKIIN